MSEQNNDKNNEELNNNEKNIGEKSGEAVKDTAEMAKEAVDLAKNIETANAAGIAKNAVNLLKNKQFRIRLIINALAPLIVILFIAGMLLGVFNAVGNVVQSIVDGVVDFFTIDHDGAIEISETQIDTIINGITEMGISMDGLKLMGDVDYNDPDIQAENQEALRRYIKEFYEAQAMTQTLNTKPNWFESWTAGDKPYGTVYVHRTQGEDTVEPTKKNQLEYISYDEMVKKQQNGDKNITKYFSISETGELVVAGWTNTVMKKDGKEVSNETNITLRNINYKNVISQYTTSMNFFLYLAMITQNPEFVSEVTDLVKQSEIRITLLDTDSTIYSKETYTYILNTETKTKVESNSINQNSTQDLETEGNKEKKTEITEVTTTSKIPNIQVTYVKTWFSEQTINYNKKTNGPNVNKDTVKIKNEDKPELSGEGSVTWKTDQEVTYETSNTSEEYEEGTRGDVIDKTGEKGDGKKSFIGLLDEKFKIPNTTRYDSAGGNLVSGAEMFFYLLQKDAQSQNLEQVMRYILYKYTGKDYGVTELDFNIFEIGSFNLVSSNVLGNSIEEKVWYSLRNMGFSEYAVAGVMGNIYGESGFDPAVVEHSNGIGFGLCQWSYGRRTQLEAYAASKGVSPSDVDTQIEFLMAELTPGGGANGYASYQLMKKTYGGETCTPDQWRNANSVAEATKAFCFTFERPKNPYNSLTKRTNAAQQYYDTFKGKTMSVSTGERMTLQELFPDGVPTSEAEVAKYITSVEIKYNDKNGELKTKNVRIHKAIAQEVQEIFDEIQKSGFRAYNIGTYNYRKIAGSSKLSNHAYGLAVDINPTENYCIRSDGTVISGSFWKPYENQYSIPADGPVVNAFKARGWDWGGDWRSKKDYMHFSKNGG